MPDVYPIPGLPLFNISKEFLLHLFAVGDLRFFLGSGSSCCGIMGVSENLYTSWEVVYVKIHTQF